MKMEKPMVGIIMRSLSRIRTLSPVPQKVVLIGVTGGLWLLDYFVSNSGHYPSLSHIKGSL